MFRPKKFKLYTHHHLHFKLSFSRGRRQDGWLLATFYVIGSTLMKAGALLGRFVYDICYAIGWLLLSGFGGALSKLKKDFAETKRYFSKRLSLFWQPNFAKTLAFFVLLAFFWWGGLESLNLVVKGLGKKTEILDAANLGGKYLTQAKNALESRNFDEANAKFLLAYKSFDSGRAQLDAANDSVLKLLNLLPQTQDAQNLLDASTLISRSGTELVSFLKNVQGLKITAQGLNTGQNLGRLSANLSRSLTLIEDNLSLAGQKFDAVSESNLPSSQRELFLKTKEDLHAASKTLKNLREVFELVKQLTLGKKNVLVLFENNNELRPTGGFVGTYGNFHLTDGKIEKLTVSSIYDLDGQIAENIVPPTPILSVNDRWLMRDSNWFAHFPDSARKIGSFYEKSGGETPDLVIAMTPNLIIDFLKVLGPVPMPKYEVTLTAENFVEETQIASSVNYDRQQNQPKQILADLVLLLLQRMGEPQTGVWPVVLEALQNNLNAKQLVIYSRDQEIQTALEKFNWAGMVLATDRDYLSVVSSNLGGTKTDLFIDQKIELASQIAEDGSVIDELTISRTNRMPNLEHTQNTSFIRVLVPKGSVLLGNTGFDYKILDTKNLKGYQTDPDVYAWERNSVRDVLTGTVIGEEGQKTFFGNWLTVEGGETKTVKLTYKLPFKLAKIDKYSLLLQRQMGATDQSFAYSLNFSGRKLEWSNFNPDKLETSSLETELVLNKDYLLGEVFSSR